MRARARERPCGRQHIEMAWQGMRAGAGSGARCETRSRAQAGVGEGHLGRCRGLSGCRADALICCARCCLGPGACAATSAGSATAPSTQTSRDDWCDACTPARPDIPCRGTDSVVLRHACCMHAHLQAPSPSRGRDPAATATCPVPTEQKAARPASSPRPPHLPSDGGPRGVRPGVPCANLRGHAPLSADRLQKSHWTSRTLQIAIGEGGSGIIAVWGEGDTIQMVWMASCISIPKAHHPGHVGRFNVPFR